MDRGLTAFERFGYLQRNGQAYIATPLGRWEVPDRPRISVNLLIEVDDWLSRLERVARDDKSPTSFARVARQTREAMMDVCRHDTPLFWQEVLIALGAGEQALSHSPKTTVDQNLRPLPSLSTDWLKVCDDGSPEFRLALSLASIRGIGKIGPLRSNMVPLADWGRWPRFNTDRMDAPEVVWGHGDLIDGMAAALQRRCMDAGRLDVEGLPLWAARPAPLSDVRAFIYGEIDERKLEGLLWGLNAVSVTDASADALAGRASLPVSYALLRLTHLPGPIRLVAGGPSVEVPYEADITRLAVGGRLREAILRAARRLAGVGLRPASDLIADQPELSRRIAASLLFPISYSAISTLCTQAFMPSSVENAFV